MSEDTVRTGANWPLTGRAEELRALAAFLDHGRGGHGALLVGAPGVGKTRLAREAVAAAAVRRGAVVRWAAGSTSARSIPLGALAHLLPPVVGGADGPLSLLLQARTALDDAGSGGRLVLVVDDAHLLDDTSATLVHQLALTRAVALVLTLRRGAPAPDGVVALWKDDLIPRYDIGCLGQAEVAELLSSRLGAPVEGASLTRLWTLTGGNPLLLVEVVHAAQAAGQLEQSWGVWRWVGDLVPTARLSDLVGRRLVGLSVDQRSLVEALAFGGRLGVPVAVRLSSDQALVDAEAAGLVTVTHDCRRYEVCLAQPLDADVVRAETPPLRARQIRRRLLTAQPGGHCRRRDDAVRRATLQLAIDGTADGDLLVTAAARANRADPLAGERMAAAALAAGSGFAARMELAAALACQGRGLEARDGLLRAAATAKSDEERAEAALHLARILFWRLGAPEDAEEALATAEASLGDSAPARRLAALRASFMLFRGRPGAAIEMGSGVLGSIGGDDPAVLPLAAMLSHALARRGRVPEALAAVDRGWTGGQTGLAPGGGWLALTHSEVTVRILAGSLDEAEALAQASRRRCLAEAGGACHAVTNIFAGQIALARGQATTGARRFREAAGVLVDDSPGPWLYRALLGLTEALALTADVAGARRALQNAAATRLPTLAIWDPDAIVAEAWIAVAAGEMSRASTLLDRARSVAAQRGEAAVEAAALHGSVRLGSAGPQITGRLAELGREIDSPLVSTWAAHAAASSEGDGVMLHGVSLRFEALGAWLLAAEAANQSALAHRREGRRASAHASTERARELACRCEGARTPALEQTGGPAPLTRREREVSGLAARGLSNRDIADLLVVSVRTVEGHLEQVYAKLGLCCRGDLALATGAVPVAQGAGNG